MKTVDSGCGRKVTVRADRVFAWQRREGMSVVEILVVLGVLATLIATCAFGAKSVGQRMQTAKCGANLRQLGSVALVYAADHDMSLPVTSHQRSSGGVSWTKTLQDYAGGNRSFRCPSDERQRSYTYVINDYLTPHPAGAPDLDYSRLSRLENPSRTFLFAEAAATHANVDHFHFTTYLGLSLPPEIFASQVGVKRHQGTANYVFADGHLERLSWETVQSLLRHPRSGFVEPLVQTP